jgi:hypothetical protein
MLFGRLFRDRLGARKPERAALDRVKAWAVAVLQAPPSSAITVSEIVCTDPSCPGIETVILIMAPGEKTRAAKVSKAAEAVTEQDVRGALV